MLKKFGLLTISCLSIFGCQLFEEKKAAEVPFQTTAFTQPKLKVPESIVVCRDKQCAPAKLSTSKEFIYNTLLHMLDSNARKKALVCAANANTHVCIEEYVSLPVTVGITPAYMYIDDVKITDISISSKNTSALELVLNWNVSYNGQTPTCRPSKTLLYVKNINNVVMEDNGYTCRMTTIGVSTIKTLFAIDYIDLDYGFIGGFYSIGMSGPAYGGGTGYMLLRLPEDISVNPKDFQPAPKNNCIEIGMCEPLPPCVSGTAGNCPELQPKMSYVPVANTKAENANKDSNKVANEQAPNVDTIIKYNHPSKDYDTAKLKMEKKRKEEAEAMDYKGVKVMPLPADKMTKKRKSHKAVEDDELYSAKEGTNLKSDLNDLANK